MSKFYVYRTSRTLQREYLAIRHFEFSWLSINDYGDYNGCKRSAKVMTENEATFAIYLIKLSKPLANYEYAAEMA